MTIILTLSIPSKDLSPNGGEVYWRRKAEAKKAARQEGFFVATNALNERGIWTPPHWKSATTRIKWYAKTKQKADADNMLACCKSVLDGIADSGIVENDRCFRHEPVERLVDAKAPRLVIEIYGEE